MRRHKYYCGLAHPRTLSSLYLLSTLNVTHVIKSSRPSPAFHVMGSKVAYNKYAPSGSGPGNEAIYSSYNRTSAVKMDMHVYMHVEILRMEYVYITLPTLQPQMTIFGCLTVSSLSCVSTASLFTPGGGASDSLPVQSAIHERS